MATDVNATVEDAERAYWELELALAELGLEFSGLAVGYWARGGPRINLGSIDVATAVRVARRLKGNGW